MEKFDYIINVGVELEPYEVAFSTKEAAIKKAKELLKYYSHTEVVFMPEDDVDTNDVVWRSWNDKD